MEKAKESSICPYCLSPIAEHEEHILCPVCGVAHHGECWRMNGKCSVYGCDGWQAWSADIAEKIAPKLKGGVHLEDADLETTERPRYDGPVCMECGRPVKRGQLTCFKCRRKGFRFLENCFGPSIIIVGGIIAAVTLLLKGLI